MQTSGDSREQRLSVPTGGLYLSSSVIWAEQGEPFVKCSLGYLNASTSPILVSRSAGAWLGLLI